MELCIAAACQLNDHYQYIEIPYDGSSFILFLEAQQDMVFFYMVNIY